MHLIVPLVTIQHIFARRVLYVKIARIIQINADLDFRTVTTKHPHFNSC